MPDGFQWCNCQIGLGLSSQLCKCNPTRYSFPCGCYQGALTIIEIISPPDNAHVIMGKGEYLGIHHASATQIVGKLQGIFRRPKGARHIAFGARGVFKNRDFAIYKALP